jgi:hypothetical protein
LTVSEAKRLKELETENTRLKKLLAESCWRTRSLVRRCEKSGSRTGTPAVVRQMVSHGLSEWRALRVVRVVRMSASALHYEPAPDSNVSLRKRILALAHRHRRYGAGMIYLELRQAGVGGSITSDPPVRLDQAAGCASAQAQEGSRVRMPAAGAPAADTVWSMNYVFDRTAESDHVPDHRR